MKTLYVRHGRLHYFVREIFKRLRVPAPDASKIADMMVAADLAGREEHGVARVPFFAERLSAELINPKPEIATVHEAAAAATVDGDNGMGPVVAHRAMTLALRKAEKAGAAAVAVRRSNDFGFGGYYARLAVERQMIGIVLSNAAPSVVPPGDDRPFYGVNPVAVAIPSVEGTSPFLVDVPTSATSRGAIEAARRRGERLPEGVALARTGTPTRDPDEALAALRFLPLGGETGYGLGLAVEILCGLLGGGAFGPELAGAEGGRPGVARIGHFFLALRIRSFGPWVQFRNRMAVLRQKLTAAPGRRGRVAFPGEREDAIEQERRAMGIPIPGDVAATLKRLALGLDLEEAWDHLLEGQK